MELDRYAKAVVGALLAGLGAVGVALTSNNDVTASEWVVIATTVIASLGLIWGVANKANPSDIPLSSVIEAARIHGFELAPPGSTAKADMYDQFPEAMTSGLAPGSS